MANYVCAQRTNYFRVTNVEAFEALIGQLQGEDSVEIFTKEIGGVAYYGFGSCAPLAYYPDGDDEDAAEWEGFEDELAKLLPDDEAVIILEAGHEKLRYVTGGATVITNNGSRYIDLRRSAVSCARELLGNPNWETEAEY